LSGCGGLSALAIYADAPLGDTGLTATTTTTSGTTSTTTQGTDTTGATASGAPLVISEVCDHADIPDIKYVELKNVGSADVALGSWTLAKYTNGSTLPAEFQLPNGDLAPGSVYVIVNEPGRGTFESTYSPADSYTTVTNGNGNDTYALIKDGVVYDILGEVGVDGAGTNWDYADSVATRNDTVTESRGDYKANEWTITSGSAAASPGT
jgi:hypothetical protein